MKTKYLAVTILTITLVAHYAFAKKGGTSILHWKAHASFTGTGSGSVDAKRNQQGNADNQRLQINVSGLDADAAYTLLANGDAAVDFTTDSSGNAALDYVKKNNGNGGAGGDPLPSGLDPISGIRTLEVSAGGTQTVLSANLPAAQLLIKRTFTNDGVDADAAASLRIKSSASGDQLRIRASGLDANGTYYLAINDAIADSFTSDGSGALSINGFPVGSPALSDITDLAIWNSESNSVLSTTLP